MPVNSTWSIDGTPSVYEKKLRVFDLDLNKEFTANIKDNSFYQDNLENFKKMADKKIHKVMEAGNKINIVMIDSVENYCEFSEKPVVLNTTMTVRANSKIEITIPTSGGDPKWYGEEGIPEFFELGHFTGKIVGTPPTSAQFYVMAANGCGLTYNTMTIYVSGA